MKFKTNDSRLSSFKRYLERKHLSTKSISYYMSDIRVFLRWVKTENGRDNILKEDFESYEIALKQNSKTTTINRKLSALRVFNQFLIDEGELSEYEKSSLTNRNRKVHGGASSISSLLSIMEKHYQGLSFATLFVVVLILGSVIVSQFKERGELINSLTDGSYKSPVISDVRGFQGLNMESLPAQASIGTILIEEDPLTLGKGNSRITGRNFLDSKSTEKTIYIPGTSSGYFVFLTPLTNIKGNALYVKGQKEDSFTVSLTSPVDEEVWFNWMIIQNDLVIDSSPME